MLAGILTFFESNAPPVRPAHIDDAIDALLASCSTMDSRWKSVRRTEKTTDHRRYEVLEEIYKDALR